MWTINNVPALALCLVFNCVFFCFAIYWLATYPHWIYDAQCAITGYDLRCPTPLLCQLIQNVQNMQLCNTRYLRGVEVAHGTYEQLKLTIEAKFAVLNTFTVETLKECWVKNVCNEAVFVEPYDPQGYGALVVFLFTLLVSIFALATNIFLLARTIYFRYKEKKRTDEHGI